MFALALISASLVPGSIGAKPQQKDPRYWNGDVFNAYQTQSTWKLQGPGKTCGHVIPHLLNVYTKKMNENDAAKRYYPLGCAIKTKNGSERGGEQPRWFIYDNEDRTIRYYKPTNTDLAELILEGDQEKINSAVRKFQGNQRKAGVSLDNLDPIFETHHTRKKNFYPYVYPALKFSLETDDTKKATLKLIFACDWDRDFFANQLAAAISQKDEILMDAKMLGKPTDPASADSSASAAKTKPQQGYVKTLARMHGGDLKAFRNTDEFQNAYANLHEALEKLKLLPKVRMVGVAGDSPKKK